MNRAARAILLTTVLVVVGTNIVDMQSLLIQHFRGTGLPSTTLFADTFSFLWLPAAAACAWCGLAGGYVGIRDGTLASGFLTAFGVLALPMVKVDGQELGAAAWRISFYLGWDRFSVGINVLAIAYLVWLGRLRGCEPVHTPTSPHPTSSTESNLL